MKQSQFMKRMVKLMKAEKKDPFKSGESFTTLNNVAAREKEHHQLLREQGFPSEQPLEGARYQRYSEHTSDPDSPDGVNHNQPPWIVNEVSEMLYEIPDDDAPSAKIKKALISLNKRINILKGGGYPRQYGELPQQPVSKLTRRQKIEKQNEVDYPQIEKGKLARSEGMNYGGAVTPERYQSIEKDWNPFKRGPSKEDIQNKKYQEQDAAQEQARLKANKDFWANPENIVMGQAILDAHDAKKTPEFPPSYNPDDIEKGLGDVARKVGRGAKKADAALGRKIRQTPVLGDVVRFEDKVYDKAKRGIARGAEKLTGKPAADKPQPAEGKKYGNFKMETAPGLKEKYPDDKFLQSLATAKPPKFLQDKPTRDFSSPESIKAMNAATRKKLAAPENQPKPAPKKKDDTSLPPFLEQSLTKRLIKLEKVRRSRGRSGPKPLYTEETAPKYQGSGSRGAYGSPPDVERPSGTGQGEDWKYRERIYGSVPGRSEGMSVKELAASDKLADKKKAYSILERNAHKFNTGSKKQKMFEQLHEEIGTMKQTLQAETGHDWEWPSTDVAPQVPFAESKQYPKKERPGKAPEGVE